MKKKHLALGLFTLCLCLTACGSKKDQDLAADFNEIQNVGSNSDAPQEKVEFSPVHVDGYEYEVSTDLGGFGRGNVIYNAQYIQYDDDYLKAYADNLFDKDSWEVCKPFQICDEMELNDRLEDIVAAEKEAGTHMAAPSYYMNLITCALENYDETDSHSFGESCIASYPLGDDYSKAALFEGTIDGEKYALMYNEFSVTYDDYATLCNLGMPPTLRIQRLTPSLKYSHTYPLDYAMLDNAYGENSITEEKAKNEAELFLSKLGYTNFVVESTGKRACGSDSFACYDGYTFLFTRQIGDTTCPISGFTDISPIVADHMHGMSNDSYEEETSIVGHQEFIRVDVDSNGIVLVDLYNMYEIGDAMSEDINLLSSDKAIEIANQYIYHISETTSPVKINIEFKYIPYTYENNTVFMPVWYFSQPADSLTNEGGFDTRNLNSDYPLCIVSAVDGSVCSYTGYLLNYVIFDGNSIFYQIQE